MDTKRPVNRREVATWAKARDIGFGDIDRLGREGGLLRIESPVQDAARNSDRWSFFCQDRLSVRLLKGLAP
jgi:hypothetical protein